METQTDHEPGDTALAQPASTVDDLLPDELHLPFGRFLGELVDIEAQVSDLPDVQALSIEQIRVDLPVEMRLEVGSDGRLQVLGSPPTQRTETTILPVFHRLVLRVVRDATNDG